MKCPSCQSRKGKRFCPGLNQTICSVCCGEKRVVEIRCPADCPFLQSGSQYQSQRHYIRQMRGPDAALFEEVLFEKQQILHSLQAVLVRLHRVFRDFSDRHAQEAVEKVLQTCETESKGVIYQYSSTTPHVQAAIKDLLEEVGRLRQGGKEREHPVKLGDIITCLKFLNKDIAGMAEKDSSAQAYLAFIAGFFPAQERSSSLIY